MKSRYMIRAFFAGALAVSLGVPTFAAGGTTTIDKHKKAAYLSPEELNFVRPGLTITITEASIGADGLIKVRFKLTDLRGAPLDRLGVNTPGPVSTSFIVAALSKDTHLYTAYTTRNVSSTITGKSATQATSDSGGSYQQVADGEYIYTFNTRAPSGYDRTATHAIGIYSTRNLSEFDLPNDLTDAVFHFVPSGAQVTDNRDIVSTDTCNSCHGKLGLHGGSRQHVQLCIMCHQPQSSDPDTGNTVDMTAMVHKIHMGEELPSVQAGKPYQIIGFGNSVNDYSTVAFPVEVQRCETCHDPKAATQANLYATNPTMRACGSCHDNVNFATGENHAGLPQVSDNQCKNCHQPEGELEFDLSIRGAHTVARFSKSLPGVNFKLMQVSGTGPGQNPTVTFGITNNNAQPLLPADMTRLALVLAGPTTDYTTAISEDARSATGSNGVYTYTFKAPVPANAKGSWSVGIEGYKNATLLPGTLKEQVVRNAGLNQVLSFGVTDAKVVARRAIVSLDKCNACHIKLDLHGNNRNTVDQCVLCHNPTATDAARRPADAGAPQGINFKEMIHMIHTGEELQQDLTIYGFGGSLNNFNEVRFPNDRSNCEVCHLPGTYQLPLPTTNLASVQPRGLFNPQPAATGACLSCHTKMSSAAHADVNISPRLGESCEACHGPNADFSIDRVHAQ